MPRSQRSFTNELIRQLLITVLVRHVLPALWRWVVRHLDVPALLAWVLGWF